MRQSMKRNVSIGSGQNELDTKSLNRRIKLAKKLEKEVERANTTKNKI